MSNNGWIKYSERKPEKSGRYLIHEAGSSCFSVAGFAANNDVIKHQLLLENYRMLIDLAIEDRDYEKLEVLDAKIHDGIIESLFPFSNDNIYEEGFWDCGVDDFGEWCRLLTVDYWTSIPELPNE